MTQKLTLNFEWQRPDGVQGEELRATWAWFEAWIGESCLTRVFDRKARTVRSALHIPLYPLAEWIAWNWWPLFHEPEVHWLREQRGYAFRHNLRSVGEGIAMPNVELRPQGRMLHVVWEPASHLYSLVDFLGQGKALADLEQVVAELYGFVDSVIARLEEEGVGETQLRQAWDAILQTLTDLEEQDFCQAVALQGRDPYTLTEEEENRILETARILPQTLLEDFLQLGSWTGLLEQAQALNKKIEILSENPGELTQLIDLRRALSNPDDRILPWDQGYALARTVRAALGTNGYPPSSLEKLAGILGVSSHRLCEVVRVENVFAGVEALLGENKRGSPGFILRPRSKQENQVFAFCRALGDYFLSSQSPSLVSSGNTERQKRNRAFAAEFLAPAEMIKKYLSAVEVTLEDIEDIAHELGVSLYVVLHQVQNHDLATIYSEES